MATTEQDPPQDPGAKPTKATTRTYVVLQQAVDTTHVPDDTWVKVGTAEASTDRGAIDKLVKADSEGTWVAIPERSFNPRTRKFDQPPPRPVWS